jgi:hypothetical protein
MVPTNGSTVTNLTKRAATVLLALLLLYALVGNPLRGQVPSGYTKINTAPITGTTYTDSTCLDATNCTYVATAVNSSGVESQPSAASNVASIPTSGTHTVSLAWTASATPGVTYNLYRIESPLPPGAPTAAVN